MKIQVDVPDKIAAKLKAIGKDANMSTEAACRIPQRTRRWGGLLNLPQCRPQRPTLPLVRWGLVRVSTWVRSSPSVRPLPSAGRLAFPWAAARFEGV